MITYALNSIPTLNDTNNIFAASGNKYIQLIIKDLIDYVATESN